MDLFAPDRHVKFPGASLDKSSKSHHPSGRKLKKDQSQYSDATDVHLEDICSDISEAPRLLKATEVCHGNQEEPQAAHVAYTTEEYIRQREQENQAFEANALSSVESLAPFRLKWVYGRLPNVEVINLTGLYKNHIAYAASNIVIIYDYVANDQQCLQGHKNTLTSLVMDKQRRFLASADAGYKSLIIIWDVLTGKALKFFPDPHEGKGCATITFTGVDFILASIGAEEAGKQSIYLWDFDPSHQRKTPLVVGLFPQNIDLLRELSFDESRPQFFTATGDKTVVFCTWMRSSLENEKEPDSIFCFKPRKRTNFMAKYKKFCNSLWMKEGKWLVTSTMSGYVCVWTPPVVLGLEDPPDPKKNIRELRRYFKLSEDGLTYFTLHKEYVVVGDERGIIRFFDHDFKVLRWTKNFYLTSIQSIYFNLTDELPAFKQALRQKFDREDKSYLRKENNSRVRDYSLGGTKDRELSMTNLPRLPMPCTDFMFTTQNGDIHYYHFRQNKNDLLVNGTPGRFVTCDVCPGSNNVIFSTRKGEVHVYDFTNHKLIFSDRIFTGSHRVCTMKFHPTGLFVCFGLMDGLLCFRRNFSWKTLIAPLPIVTYPIVRIIFSIDGILCSYFTNNRIIVLLKYLPKAKSWISIGKCRTHQLDICDVQFLHDPVTKRNRLFSLALDRYLVEYDIPNSNPGDLNGLRVLRILKLEETCQPTAMVFDGPSEFGEDCITFSNTLNKLRVFEYKEQRVRKTVSGPVFGREHAINRMIEFPAQMSATRFKKFIIFVRGNKLGIMDTPLDGNPHKYMAVFTHPGNIVEICVVPDREQIFTIGYQDNAALQWEACVRSVEATVLMGGSGILPFYHTLRRNWGGACQDVVKDIDLIFFFLNLKRVDTQTDIFNITRTVRISEIPAVCRACGFYPSEYEVGLMIDEARRIKMLDQHYSDDETTDFALEDFIKLFSNHFYRISDSEVEDAFRFLGFEEKEDPYICRSDFVYFLTSEGEKLKPPDFPIYFESMYMDQALTVFSDIQCHVKTHAMSVSSASGNSGTEAQTPQEIIEGDSSSSSSSSTLTGDDDGEGSGEQVGSKETSDGKETTEVKPVEPADDDDDDDDDAADGGEEEGAAPKKKKPSKDVEDDDDDDDDDDEPRPKKKTRKSSFQSDEKAVSENVEEETVEEYFEADEDSEDLMDLPERIDLAYFLLKMLPPECQQTIRWRPEFRQKRLRELSLQPEEKQRQMNKLYYDKLIKQIIDPNFPIPKKMLNALYAEYYMEHGNFGVPPELEYPEYGNVEDSWYAEGGDDDENESTSSSLADSLAPSKTNIEDMGEDSNKDLTTDVIKKSKSKAKITTFLDLDEEDDEEDDGETDYVDDSLIQSVVDLTGDDSTLAPGVFQSFRSDEYEGGEDSTRNYETEEGERGSIFSAPFSISEQPQSMEESSTVPTGGGTGTVPGYNSDNTEFYSDVENAYEEEEMAFIREVNESFRPPQGEGGEKRLDGSPREVPAFKAVMNDNLDEDADMDETLNDVDGVTDTELTTDLEDDAAAGVKK